MLTKWSADNFKSLCKAELSLGPINVFAGANSSGKSTLIQSILIIKQTFQYAPVGRAIALNGPIIKLGNFDDVKNSSSEDDFIRLAWSINVPRGLPRSTGGFSFGVRQSLSSVDFDCQWDVPAQPETRPDGRPLSDELKKLQPKLRSVAVGANRKEVERKPYALKLERSNKRAPVEAVSEAMSFVSVPRHLDYDLSSVDDNSRREIYGNRIDASVEGAAISHFLPAQIGVRFDAGQQRARGLATSLCADSTFDEFESDELGGWVSSSVVDVLVGWLSENGVPSAAESLLQGLKPDDDEEYEVADIAERFRALRHALAHERPQLANIFLDITPLQNRLVEEIRKGNDEGFQMAFELPRAISEAGEVAKSYFVNFVRYLGPLRDEPKHVYPLEALANPNDVGYKGEHTAAVLELNSDKNINYIPSDRFSSDGARLEEHSVATLSDAVIDWLQYMGVARGISTQDQGVFGHQLQVKTDAQNRFHDLTNVGVGVSQVLPIIVGALLAPRGSCLIYEQPELHLHPKVQARLADFFIAMSYSNKQCILETHSEYLVDRFRLRIAQAADESMAARVKLFFTSISSGNTRCEPVEISSYGAVVNWPEDFFDQSQREVEAIIRAARLKRQKAQTDKRGDH